jgi:hypothetical protein
MACLLGTILFATACGDWTSSMGEEGRLYYTLYTEYETPQAELRDAKIVTGHLQRIDVSLTAKGYRDIDSPGSIAHSARPDQGVSITGEGGSESSPPDIRILVDDPGRYTIESRADGEVVDWIELQFEMPETFQLISLVRPPWGEDFLTMTGDPIQVEEGSQVAFQPVPEDGQGQRLAGDMTTELGVEPDWAVVPGMSVGNVYEDGYWSIAGEANFYFIDPGIVTFTVTDPVSGATGEQTFEVTPVARD